MQTALSGLFLCPAEQIVCWNIISALGKLSEVSITEY